MTTIKVKVPFGMSSNKYQEKQTIEPGPGFYDNKSSWVKNTFNIKGKIPKWNNSLISLKSLKMFLINDF